MLLLLGAGAGAVLGQPFIAYRGVVNAASSFPEGLPGGAIARGSTFTIYGRRLGPAASPPLAFPLATTLGGVSITVTQGTTTLNAIPVFVSAGQINAILPSNTPLGLVTLRVIFNNVRSNPAPIRIVNSSFGIFAANRAGTGPGILQNYEAPGVEPINALNASARRGQVITLWGTGLGPVQADNVAPPPVSLPTPTEVFVGGVAAAIHYNGRSPCCAGIDQIVFTIPNNAPLGCWVPVYVKTDRTAVSNFVTMAITDSGTACSEPSNPIASTLIRGGRSASVLAARFNLRADTGVAQPTDASTDYVGGFFAEEPTDGFNFNPLISLPPAGTCASYGIIGNLTRTVSIPFMLPRGRALSSGTVTFTNSRGAARTAAATQRFGFGVTHLGSTLQLFPQLANLFFDTTTTISAPGGPDIGAFSAQVTIPQGLTWTNRDQLNNITRSQGFTVNWSGAAPNHGVFVAGGVVDVPSNASNIFICRAAPGVNSFTVPPDILANIAPARTRATDSIGAIYFGQWPLTSPVTFTASGIESGAALGAQILVKTVVFR